MNPSNTDVTTAPDLSREAFTVWLNSDLDALLDQPRGNLDLRCETCPIADFIASQGFPYVLVNGTSYSIAKLDDRSVWHRLPDYAVAAIRLFDDPDSHPKLRRDALALLETVPQ